MNYIIFPQKNKNKKHYDIFIEIFCQYEINIYLCININDKTYHD